MNLKVITTAVLVSLSLGPVSALKAMDPPTMEGQTFDFLGYIRANCPDVFNVQPPTEPPNIYLLGPTRSACGHTWCPGAATPGIYFHVPHNWGCGNPCALAVHEVAHWTECSATQPPIPQQCWLKRDEIRAEWVSLTACLDNRLMPTFMGPPLPTLCDPLKRDLKDACTQYAYGCPEYPDPEVDYWCSTTR